MHLSLWCVVRGDTPHFDYVCKAVTDGVVQLNLVCRYQLFLEFLQLNNEEQARERIGGKHGHKGEEAAITALKMILVNLSICKKIKTNISCEHERSTIYSLFC